MARMSARDHVVADQEAIFALLADPSTYGVSEPVRRIDTHGAVIFLAGDTVYKVKRAVRFSFMDFSTLEKRRRACAREVELNRATAPGTLSRARADPAAERDAASGPGGCERRIGRDRRMGG